MAGIHAGYIPGLPVGLAAINSSMVPHGLAVDVDWKFNEGFETFQDLDIQTDHFNHL
jgi:hypothetical protein